jgi:hypothetical protein
MASEVPLRNAIETAWTVYLATHSDVDAADDRRCLLERHMQGRLESNQSEAEELTCSALAYLDRIPKTNGEADRVPDRTSNNEKRAAGLDVAGPFLSAFGGGDLRDAIGR